MKTKQLFRLLTALSFLLAALPAQAVQAAAAKSAAPADLLQFTSGGHALGFAAGGMYAATGSHALHVGFLGANAIPPQADSPASADGKAAPISRVIYTNLWDGITLAYTAGAGNIYTTTYTLEPGADPGDIRLLYNTPLTLNEDGTLGIAFETGGMTESAPIAWQEIQGRRVPVDVSFRVSGQEVSFALGSYDPRYALTIDPSLVWNTFLGGSGGDTGNAITVDGSGNVYVLGRSDATWGSPVRAYTGDQDAFVAKLDSSGGLIWNTFLGGSGYDDSKGIAVDGSGNVYVTGGSAATWGSPVRAYAGGDAFAAKLNSFGALAWNTFLGGSAGDGGLGIAVDGSGNVYVTGYSGSTWGSPIRTFTGGNDAFAAKLDSSGALIWNTFLGWYGHDDGTGIVVDGSGNIYVTGYSGDTWGSPVRAFNGSYDTFAAKLDSSGGLTWNTFLGGSAEDGGLGIAVDGSGSVYVAGYSLGTWGIPVRAYTSGLWSDAFAAKLDSLTGVLSWNTFLGGSGLDESHGIAVDGSGNVYVAGYSGSTWGSPVRAYAGGGCDALVAKLNSSGGLTSNTFLGGNGCDDSKGIAVDGSGNVYVAGASDATWGNPVSAYTAIGDAFAAKVVLAPPDAFNKTAPASGSFVTTSPTITWGASSGATSYEYCRDTSNDDACNSSWISAGSSTNVGLSGLTNNRTYYWQVRATNGVGTTYANGGAWWSFTARNQTFADVPIDHTLWQYIEAFYNAGITTGCGVSPLIYCPEQPVTRAAMTVFLLRAKYGSSYTPPAATHLFADLPVAGKEWMEPWVDQFFLEGITTGCGVSPLIYCPEQSVTRAAMAVFVLRALYGSGYTPPAASHYFSDMPVAGKEWMEPWVDELYREGITTGCGTGPLIYCPETAVKRQAMAAFIVRAFSLPLP
jgi:hypothetical protein